jgi:ankyrin repeat protein
MTFSNINKDGITALELAARRKHGECVALLITNGAKTTDVSSMLLLTAECGLIDCTKQLLQEGADVTIRDENAMTPLLIADAGGYVHILELLLTHGASITDKDANENSAFLLAAKGGHVACLEFMIRHDDVDVQEINKVGESALYLAAEHRHVNAVKLLLGLGVYDVNLSRQGGDTVLMAAAGSRKSDGTVECLEMLIGHGPRGTKESLQHYLSLSEAGMKRVLKFWCVAVQAWQSWMMKVAPLCFGLYNMS